MRATCAAIVADVLFGTIVAAASTAAAQDRPTTETVPIYVDECRTEEEYGTVCMRMRGAEHQTVRPDGDAVYVSNLVYDFSLTQEDGVTTETSATVHSRLIWRAGEEVVVVRNAASRYTIDGQTCHYHAVFVVTQGDLRVNELGLKCADV